MVNKRIAIILKEWLFFIVSSKLISYTLHGGYEKFVGLPSSGACDVALPPVVPQHSGQLLPFKEAITGPGHLKNYADAGLFFSRSFRVGWGADWMLANVGVSLSEPNCTKGPVSVSLESLGITSFGTPENNQLDCLEMWLEDYLVNIILTSQKLLLYYLSHNVP